MNVNTNRIKKPLVFSICWKRRRRNIEYLLTDSFFYSLTGIHPFVWWYFTIYFYNQRKEKDFMQVHISQGSKLVNTYILYYTQSLHCMYVCHIYNNNVSCRFVKAHNSQIYILSSYNILLLCFMFLLLLLLTVCWLSLIPMLKKTSQVNKHKQA